MTEYFNRYKNKIVVLAILLVTLGVAFFYFWNNIKNEERETEKEVATVVKQVSRHILLPEGASPTVATVKDPEQLKDQPFFANAKTGDKLLIYSDARKAILYRPSEDKIVEVAPVNIGDNR